MKNFIVYDKDGNILRTGQCPDGMVEIQAKYCEFVMEGEADDTVHKIVNKKVTLKTIVPDTLVEVQSKKDAEIRDKGSYSLQQIVQPYTPQERETWQIQLEEANAYTQDPNSPTPFIDSVLSTRGTSKSEFASIVIQKANDYRTATGAILGKQQALLISVWNATTVEEVEAITW